ncbi:YgiQ family radical SAM protein [Thermosipho sp. (in: thermotogales)]|uniref:YgiQ family radical SAM protein n=1 Tax=Thermosipho sp. (in: thermotogales) TaxID=1968895 RepID=UPI002580DDDA|nr:YgiQ family radical SAM protein [Thermosipho sp. (in: thermotogales)]MBZ4649543.1 radical N-domain protein [Thermosipho sp. (in: thermotogales)]
MFLPTTRDEMNALGWKELDIILVTGDAYIDHPSIGISLIGHYLLSKGYKVGIIGLPDYNSDDITRLGKPRLFFGITSGNVDSMVANYTASMKKRRFDDYIPEKFNIRRPDRALIVYSNLVRRYFKGVPIIIGGIEASLRRFAHYDWWSNKVRKSILLDSKADILVYGMGEKAILEIARCIEKYGDINKCKDIDGVVWWSSKKPEKCVEIPSFEEVKENPEKYNEAFRKMTLLTDPNKKIRIVQRQDNRYVIQNPPQSPLTQSEFDNLYLLPFEREVHPYYNKFGKVKAIETVRFSITAVRGCYGMCAFCALTQHQTTHVISRSIDSILEEVKILKRMKKFRGTINDVGGPTANMYGSDCSIRENKGQCSKFCLFPNICNNAKVNHEKLLNLLYSIKKVPGIKNVFISSGIRHDLVLEDKKYGDIFIKELPKFTPGQLKLAPEHSDKNVLQIMRKPDISLFLQFKEKYEKVAKKRYVVAYFIVGHPGEGMKENNNLKKFIKEKLGYRPQQIQIFTPTPGTLSTTIYYTGIDPFTNRKIFVERSLKKRNLMKKNILDI